MKRHSFSTLLLLCFAFAGTSALSVTPGGETATPAANAAAAMKDSARAEALLARAVAHYQQQKDSAWSDFDSKSEFTDGELYVFAISSDGLGLSSAGPPNSKSLVGRRVVDEVDPWGNHFFREMLSKARESDSGTVEYRWLNPADGKVERKVAHFQKVGDSIIAVGHYVPRATPAHARALLARAIDALGSIVPPR